MAKRSRPGRRKLQDVQGPDEGILKNTHDTSMLVPDEDGPQRKLDENEGPDLADFAADLGEFLGKVQNRATSWLEQRRAIADQLTQIRNTANKYLQQLTGGGTSEGAPASQGRRRGRRPGGAAGAGAAKKTGGRRKMSAAARKRISDAQKARWARQRKQAE